jgi:cysteine desulfurase/selenocysteine lyase
MLANTMSTAEHGSAAIGPSEPGAADNLGDALGAAIHQLANQLWAGAPAATQARAAERPEAPGVHAPPNLGRSTLNIGGGRSLSPALPPTPGMLQTPPIASAPLPQEKDLRTVPTIVADLLGLSSAAPLVGTPTTDAGASLPYFLSAAGSPSTAAAPSSSSAGLPSIAGLASARSAPAPVYSGGDFAAPPSGASAAIPAGSTFHPELAPHQVPVSAGLFDAASVRRDFPILAQRVHGRRLVWLDNAATTQKPQLVIDRLSQFYKTENSNIHRAAHTLAARATDAYEGARDKSKRFLNASSSNELVFVRGATEAINLVAQSWGRRHLVPGDEIVISWLEHHANIVPWQQLCAEKNLSLRVAPVDDRGQILLEEYEKLLNRRTRLVAFTQVSNALGTITPAQEMVAMAHRYGARVLVDGAQAVSHMPVDVQALDCDFYVFSGHKVFAPTGIGVLFGKAEALDEMPPWQGGGNMIADVTFEKTTYQKAPAKFEAGTGNIADAVGLGAAIDYVSSLGLVNIARYEHELLVYGTERLVTVPGLTLVGTAAEKAGVLSFVVAGLPTEDLGGALDREGIAVRSGHHCAQPILRRFGLERTVRASLAPYNTREDIDILVDALMRLTANRRR